MNLQSQHNARMREARMREQKALLYSRLAAGLATVAVVLALVSLTLFYVGA